MVGAAVSTGSVPDVCRLYPSCWNEYFMMPTFLKLNSIQKQVESAWNDNLQPPNNFPTKHVFLQILLKSCNALDTMNISCAGQMQGLHSIAFRKTPDLT